MAMTLLRPARGVTGSPSPQTTTVPSLLRAMLYAESMVPGSPYAAMATTLVRFDGTLVSPSLPSPHAATVPSRRKARLWNGPAATSTTLLSPAGTLHCPLVLPPQAATVPLDLTARL